MLNVGLIGLGEVAQVVHLPVLRSLPELYEVHAVCDISPTLLRSVADRFGVPRRFLDFEEMLDQCDLDAVFVLNNDEFHADSVIAALRRGLHVLVEKPMCLTRREADDILAARDRADRVVMVGYMRRFAPAFLEAVELLPRLGTVAFARVHDIIGRNRLIIDQTAHVVRPSDIPEDASKLRAARATSLTAEAIGTHQPALASAFRLLCGLGSHDLSAMRELLGPPRGVAAARQWREGRYIAALLDYGSYLVSFETGVDEQLRFDAHLEVYTETATMRVQYDTPYVRHLPTKLILEQTQGDALSRSERRPHFKDPYTCELEHFHQSVVTGTSPKTCPEDFVADLTLIGDIVDALRRPEG